MPGKPTPIISDRRKARLLWEMAGRLSTMNFSDKHPEEAYSWLVENSDDLKDGLDSVPSVAKGYTNE